MRDFDCDALGQYLTDQGFHEEVVAKFVDNRISGDLLIELEEDDLKEMFPVVGDKMRVRKLLDDIRKVDIALNDSSSELASHVNCCSSLQVLNVHVNQT